MQLPKALTDNIQILNTIGLGLLGFGLRFFYQALVSRSETLKESLNDLKEAHEEVVKAMDRRAKEIDARFLDLKKFQDIQSSLLEDVDKFRDKVSAFKEKQYFSLQESLEGVNERMKRLEDEYGSLRNENQALKIKVIELESRCNLLEDRNKQLEVELGYDKLGVRGIV